MEKIKLVYGNLNKAAFFICLSVSISLLTASFIVPPMGEIHPSVLKGVGELFGFAALSTVLVAIDRGVDAKVSKGDVSVEINNESE